MLYNIILFGWTWWNQITTPSPTTTKKNPTTTTSTYINRAKTTMPWWKRLQQKTLSQRKEKEDLKEISRSTSRPTPDLFLTTTPQTTSNTPLPQSTPPPPTTSTKVSVFVDRDLDTVSKTKESALVHLNTLGQYEIYYR